MNISEIDNLVDRFVEKINTGYREPIFIDLDKTPPSVLVGEIGNFGESDWMIKPYAHVDWVEPLEQRIGHKFPLAYRSLITRYIFPRFEAGNILFFANTPEGTDYNELRERIFCDQTLHSVLSNAGYIQFGNPDPGSVNYDPACFDMNHFSNGDCPIVAMDHEYILCDGVIDEVDQIAPSFYEYLKSVVCKV